MATLPSGLLRAQERQSSRDNPKAAHVVLTPQLQQQAMSGLARLPWAFEPNAGQTDARVKFLARADGATVYLTANGAVIAWSAHPVKSSRSPGARQYVLPLQFTGASGGVQIAGEEEVPGKTNYLIGNDPRKWRTNIPRYSAVEYGELYPGIDARFYGGPRGLEYDLAISPGSDLRRVVLNTGGAGRLRLDPQGNLLVRFAGRDIMMRRPEIYQLNDNRRIPVEGGYRLLNGNSFGFRVGEHRNDRPLIIDPSISVTYTTFLGGNGAEKGNSVAYDSVGKVVYVGGTTTLPTFPETTPTPTSLGPVSGTSVLFAAKIDTTQSGAASLSYLTFIGGSLDNEGGKVAVDNSTSPASLAIVGWTTSADFPVTDGSTLRGTTDLTVSKLNGTGSAFVYSLYFGGTASEATQSAAGVATDAAGDVFVTSDTTSIDLPQPLVPNGFQTTNGGGVSDGFLAEFAAATPSPGALLYSTYFGINATVGSTSVAVDLSGNAYIAGFTSQPSNTFPPLGVNTFQSTYGGGSDDGIVLQVNPTLVGPTSLVYASFLGGTGTDQAFAISVDNASPSNAYVTGATQSPDFVSKTSLTNGFQTTLGSGATSNAFLAVISQAPVTFVPSLAYASYLGGTGADSGQGIAVVLPTSPGPSTDVLVAGKTTSANFPVFCPSQNFTGSQDVFISSFNPTVSGTPSLALSTFLGGSVTAEANAVATNAAGDAIIFGDTVSHDYPLTSNPNNGFQPTCISCASSLSDSFVTTVSANLTPSACVALNPPAVTFGAFPIGDTTVPPVNVQLTDNGNLDLTISGMTITGPNSTNFSLSPNGCPLVPPASPPSVLIGGSCSFSLNFIPSVAGPETATLQITDNGSGNPQSIALSGTGQAAGVGLVPATSASSPLDFGTITQGSASSSQTVTLTNTGSAPLTITSVVFDSSTGTPGDFKFTGSNTCSTIGTVLPSGTCDISVNFAPPLSSPTGPVTAQVDIFDNAGGNSAAEQMIFLAGTAVAPAPVVGLSSASLNFLSENVGGTTGSQTVTLTNSGSAALNITSLGITGTDSANFQLLPATTCQVGGSGVAANGGTCNIAVDFAPQSIGSKNASVTIADNATPSPQTIALTGTGTASGVSLSTSSLTFSSQNVGSTSPGQNVTLTNNGTGPLTIKSISSQCPSSGDFCQTNSCPSPTATLPPNSACTITVTFTPTATGARSSSITISDDAPGSPQNIALSGTGTIPMVVLSPTGLSFAPTVVGTSSGTKSVTVTNTGNGPLLVSKIAVSGTNAGDFSESDTCIVGGSSVPVLANKSCAVSVNFVPVAAGSRTANLTLTDNTANGSQSFAVSGQATDFALQPSGGSSSATISAGQTAIFPLQVTPQNGFTGTVTLGCTNPPPSGGCTVSPTSIQITGTTAVSFNATVCTLVNCAAGAFALPAAPRAKNPRIPWPVWCLLALLLFALSRQGEGKRRKLVPTFALAIGLALLSSCGGGGGTTGSGTPPGTYVVTVTGAFSSGAAHPLPLTVTVTP